MLFRLIAWNPNSNEAYAERIKDFRVCDDGSVLVCSLKNETYFVEKNEILIDPVIIRKVSGEWLYKVELEG